MSRFSRISTRGDVAHFGEVGDGADRALVGFEHVDPHPRFVRQQRAAPAPRPEGADRRQRQDAGAERNDRPVRREIVGGAADRGREQDAVGHQLVEPHDAVDADPELRRLAALAQQRDLVEGDRAVRRAAARRSRSSRAGAAPPAAPRRAARTARPGGRGSSGSRRCRDACRRSARPSPRKRCKVSSMKPSPPSGTMISASSGGDAAVARRSSSSACCAASVSAATTARLGAARGWLTRRSRSYGGRRRAGCGGGR